MSWSSMLRVFWLPLLLAAAPFAEPGRSDPPCIEYWPESRYRNYGYDHIVHLHSACEASAVCEVRTNVSPEIYAVELPPRVEVEVLTFRGSPAREFIAQVTCELQGGP